jgi:SAM-dependent methyltransferase
MLADAERGSTTVIVARQSRLGFVAPNPAELQAQRRDWEDLSALDPYWAILSEPSKQHGGWDLAEFLRSGEEDVGALMTQADAYGLPLHTRRALDFGCGLGRLTRALSSRFESCVGVDVSSRMIDEARRINAGVPNCTFVVNDGPDLADQPTGSFDLVYSHLVLQHVPSRRAILRYVGELGRVLCEGGLLAFQIPTHIPMLHRLQPRPRLYRLLRRIGATPELLYRRLRLEPIRMMAVGEAPIRRALSDVGVEVLDARSERVTGGLTSSTFYATRRSASRSSRT